MSNVRGYDGLISIAVIVPVHASALPLHTNFANFNRDPRQTTPCITCIPYTIRTVMDLLKNEQNIMINFFMAAALLYIDFL